MQKKRIGGESRPGLTRKTGKICMTKDGERIGRGDKKKTVTY